MLQQSKSDKVAITIDDNVSQAVAHNGVTVTIDRTKCRYSMYDPTGCRKCIVICPVRVFATRPLEKRDFTIPPKERQDPTIWVLLATWADWCNGCAACINECPHDALEIQFEGKSIK